MPWDIIRGGYRTVNSGLCNVVLVEQKLHPCWLQTGQRVCRTSKSYFLSLAFTVVPEYYPGK